MALGFIKKVFSFGKKEVEERPEDVAISETAAVEPKPESPSETPPQIEPDKPDEIPPAPEPEPAPQEPTAPEPAPEIPPQPEPGPAPGEPSIPHPEVPEPLPDAPVQTPEPGTEVPEPTPEQPSSPPTEVPQAVPPPQPAVEPQSTREEVAARADELVEGRITVSRSVERKREQEPDSAVEEPRKPWFQRLREGLFRSSQELRENISSIFLKRKLDEDTLQDLEDVLLRADLGLETAMRITDALSAGRYGKDISGAEVQAVMAEEIEKVLAPVALPLELDLSHKPHVILVVGVNGTGKTTTIGKLAAKLTEGGLKVMLAAGDTFRAAAIEQLKIWGERTGSPVVSSKLGADAAGLAYDAYEKAKAAGSDVLIIDTAGRLQNRAELMAELEKIVRVLGKHDPDAPHTVLQTLDATTGQNALNQVEIFRNVAGVTGLVMTKLDGTARGGILVAIAAKHKLPVYFIGVGEGIDDLEPFSAGDFAKAIAGVT